MATITITISTADATRVTHALCVSAGLPETAANAKQAVINYIKKTVSNVELIEAQQTALKTVVPATDVTPT